MADSNDNSPTRLDNDDFTQAEADYTEAMSQLNIDTTDAGTINDNDNEDEDDPFDDDNNHNNNNNNLNNDNKIPTSPTSHTTPLTTAADASRPLTDKEKWDNMLREAIMHGYLTKEGSNFKTWRRRYFVLRKYSLSYHRTYGDPVPIKTYNTNNCLVAHCPEKGKNACFKVFMKGRVLYVFADTTKEKKRWMEAIISSGGFSANDAKIDDLDRATKALSEVGLELLGADNTKDVKFALEGLIEFLKEDGHSDALRELIVKRLAINNILAIMTKKHANAKEAKYFAEKGIILLCLLLRSDNADERYRNIMTKFGAMEVAMGLLKKYSTKQFDKVISTCAIELLNKIMEHPQTDVYRAFVAAKGIEEISRQISLFFALQDAPQEHINNNNNNNSFATGISARRPGSLLLPSSRSSMSFISPPERPREDRKSNYKWIAMLQEDYKWVGTVNFKDYENEFILNCVNILTNLCGFEENINAVLDTKMFHAMNRSFVLQEQPIMASSRNSTASTSSTISTSSNTDVLSRRQRRGSSMMPSPRSNSTSSNSGSSSSNNNNNNNNGGGGGSGSVNEELISQVKGKRSVNDSLLKSLNALLMNVLTASDPSSLSKFIDRCCEEKVFKKIMLIYINIVDKTEDFGATPPVYSSEEERREATSIKLYVFKILSQTFKEEPVLDDICDVLKECYRIDVRYVKAALSLINQFDPSQYVLKSVRDHYPVLYKYLTSPEVIEDLQ